MWFTRGDVSVCHFVRLSEFLSVCLSVCRDMSRLMYGAHLLHRSKGSQIICKVKGIIFFCLKLRCRYEFKTT